MSGKADIERRCMSISVDIERPRDRDADSAGLRREHPLDVPVHRSGLPWSLNGIAAGQRTRKYLILWRARRDSNPRPSVSEVTRSTPAQWFMALYSVVSFFLRTGHSSSPHSGRSWTGHCIYGLRLNTTPEGMEVTESSVNRNTEHSRETDINEDRELLRHLIDDILLAPPS